MKSAINFSPMLDKSFEQGPALFERMFSAAQPGAVFSAPVLQDKFTIILASEISAGGGFGSGGGLGPAPASSEAEKTEAEAAPIEGGGGMGGGGGSFGRPVAAIVIGPDGVKIEPIVDVTKLMLAAIPAWAMLGSLFRRLRIRRPVRPLRLFARAKG
jgi:uncharacterized spore protein YtfJ